jgi:uncharacterized protein (TIGR02145 family)
VRSYASNSKGLAYGQQKEFTTKAITKPIITTTATAEILYTSATSGGNLTYDGGAAVTDKGVCWNTTGNPTVSDNKLSAGKGSGVFASKLTGLQENTTYYIRAFAINYKGTSYGEQQTFTTKEITVPILTTTAASNISYTTATSGGNITSDGGVDVTARGVCWNTTGNPTIADNKTADGTGTGSYTSNLLSLIDGTIYYVRAYATNSKGTSYGAEQTLTTTSITVPIITTSAVSNILYTSATSGGNIISDGGVAVTARGVCWNKTGNPTVTDTKTSDGTGAGSYTSNLSSLTDGTTYYVKAYATNSKGTSYGVQQTLTTTAITAPILTTTAANNISYTTATSGGNIAFDGGAVVTARGVCWNTTGNPTIADSKTSDGTGIGSYSSNLTSLTDGTVYFIRAYASNSKGINYGTESSFSTISMPSNAVKDIDGNIYTTVVIGTQTWMAENLKTTKYDDGTAIPNVTNGLVWSGLTTGAYCWYNHDAAKYKATYGALYNGYVVNTGKLCPTNWHIPSQAEWDVLISFLGGVNLAAGKLKESGTAHWGYPNTGADNSSGFTALPGGVYSSYYGTFNDIGGTGNYLSSSEVNGRSDWVWVCVFFNSSNLTGLINDGKTTGNSVRCIKD